MRAEKEATEENSRMCDGLDSNWLVPLKPILKSRFMLFPFTLMQ